MSTAVQVGETAAKPPHVFLGISAKSADIRTGQGMPADFSARLAAKVGRFALLRMSQSLVYDRTASPAQQMRVCWCHRTIVSPDGDVGVFRVKDGSNARFSGVATCGSVWHCPVCAAKITEARREELSRAMVAHVRNNGGAYLLTLTFPHESDHPLPELMSKFAKAMDRFKSCSPFKKIMGKDGNAGRIGSVRSLEVTVSGTNGWHPHTHDLVFCDRNGLEELMFTDDVRVDDDGNLDSASIRELKQAWVKSLFKAGLGDQSKLTWMMQHALNVRGGEYAAEYIAKFGRDERWGASSELTRPHSKIGAVERDGEVIHFTPFQLLLWAAEGDGWAAHRFREYADAFLGKRMLSWSPMLKKRLLGTDEEASDEALAAAPLVEEVFVGPLTDDQYAVLLSRNQLGEFLRYVSTCCSDPATAKADIDEYVEAVKASIPASHSAVRRKRRVFGGEGPYVVATEIAN
jgi:hypothetical protein